MKQNKRFSQIKKAVAVTLAVMMLLVVMAPVSFAGEHTVATLSEYRNRLASDMSQQDPSIKINYTGDTAFNTQAEAQQFVQSMYLDAEAMLNEFNRHNIVRVQFSGSIQTNPQGQYVVRMAQHNLIYKNSASDLMTADAIIATALAEIIEPGMQEHEKVRAVYEYVIDTVHYQRHRAHDEDWNNIVKERNIVTALTGGGVVCDGYALLVQRMLTALDIESKMVSGVVRGNEPHAWNMVKVYDTYYQIDTTWGDSGDPSDVDRYFLTSDTVLLTEGEHSWNQSKYPSATMTFETAQALYAVQLQEAKDAVETAEQTMAQPEVDTARILVNALRSHDQDTLQGRLDAVQAHIDAEIAYAALLEETIVAVEKAEATLSQHDTDTARDMVDELREEHQPELNERLDAVQELIDIEVAYQEQLQEAVAAVELAEATEAKVAQQAVNDARSLVADLREEDQDALEERLDAVQEQIDIANKPPTMEERLSTPEEIRHAERLVQMAEALKRDPHIANAVTAVNALTDSPQKTALLNRLAVFGVVEQSPAGNPPTENPPTEEPPVEEPPAEQGEGESTSSIDPKQLQEATLSVERAELHGFAFLIRQADGLVAKLPNSPEKSALMARMDAIR